MNGNPEMPGQRQKAGRAVGIPLLPTVWIPLLPSPSVDFSAPVRGPPLLVRGSSAPVRGFHGPGIRGARTHSGRRWPEFPPQRAYVLVSWGDSDRRSVL